MCATVALTVLISQVKSQQPQARSLAADMATELLSDLLGSRSDVAADVVDYLRSTKVKGINKDLWQSVWSFVRRDCVRALTLTRQAREIKLDANRGLIGFDESAACASPPGRSRADMTRAVRARCVCRLGRAVRFTLLSTLLTACSGRCDEAVEE